MIYNDDINLSFQFLLYNSDFFFVTSSLYQMLLYIFMSKFVDVSSIYIFSLISLIISMFILYVKKPQLTIEEYDCFEYVSHKNNNIFWYIVYISSLTIILSLIHISEILQHNLLFLLLIDFIMIINESNYPKLLLTNIINDYRYKNNTLIKIYLIFCVFYQILIKNMCFVNILFLPFTYYIIKIIILIRALKKYNNDNYDTMLITNIFLSEIFE